MPKIVLCIHRLKQGRLEKSQDYFMEDGPEENQVLEKIRYIFVFGIPGNKSRSKINCLDVCQFCYLKS